MVSLITGTAGWDYRTRWILAMIADENRPGLEHYITRILRKCLVGINVWTAPRRRTIHNPNGTLFIKVDSQSWSCNLRFSRSALTPVRVRSTSCTWLTMSTEQWIFAMRAYKIWWNSNRKDRYNYFLQTFCLYAPLPTFSDRYHIKTEGIQFQAVMADK